MTGWQGDDHLATLSPCPIDEWVALLHERTQVPVAHPYLLDPATDIFGWPYLLMPRLYGFSPTDDQLTGADQLAIARALGQNLAQLHALTWPFAGDYDLVSNTIQPPAT